MNAPLTPDNIELMQKTVAMGYGLTLGRAEAQQLLDGYAALIRKCEEQSLTISNDTERFIMVTNRAIAIAGGGTSLENALERLAAERPEGCEHEWTAECEQGTDRAVKVCRKCRLKP